MIDYQTFAKWVYKPFPEIIWKISSKNTIFLTFDDGPHSKITDALLELLDQKDVKVTFFLSGESIVAQKGKFDFSKYQNHSVGIHSFSHKPINSFSKSDIKKELTETKVLVEKFCKKKVTLSRPPYGIFNKSYLKITKELGLKTVMWSVISYDYKWSTPKVISHTLSKTTAGDIVLFHDAPFTADKLVEIVSEFIDECRKRNFTFDTIN